MEEIDRKGRLKEYHKIFSEVGLNSSELARRMGLSRNAFRCKLLDNLNSDYDFNEKLSNVIRAISLKLNKVATDLEQQE